MMMITWSTLMSTAVLGQRNNNDALPASIIIDTQRAEGESTLTTGRISRPARLKGLAGYVSETFAAKVDPSTIRETVADGRPAVTFSFSHGSQTTDSILIDTGRLLELHSETYPTWWKYAKDVEAVGTDPREERDVEPITPLDSNPKGQTSVSNLTTTVPTCAGIASPGDPYPCCTSSSGTPNMGNCTFFAWYAAKTFWGYSMPTWGGNGASNAGKWYDNSKASGLPTSITPGLYAIAVSSTLSTSGHVAWVMEIANDQALVWEQGCGLNDWGIIKRWRSISTFNKGYVLSPISAPTPTVTLATYGPLFHSGSTQAVAFRVSNVNPGARAVVTFPNGGKSTLKDGQLSLSSGYLTAYMTLNATGTWKIQVFNENGKFSAPASFWVN